MKWTASVVALDGVYLVVLGSYTPADAALGAAWAALFTWWGAEHVWRTSRPARADRSALARAVWFGPFAAVVLYDALRSSFRALRLSARAGAPAVIVEVPVGERSRVGVAVTALCSTLSPGVVFLELDERRGVMVFVHIDGRDPETARREQAEFYERHQRRVFP